MKSAFTMPRTVSLVLLAAACVGTQGCDLRAGFDIAGTDTAVNSEDPNKDIANDPTVDCEIPEGSRVSASNSAPSYAMSSRDHDEAEDSQDRDDDEVCLCKPQVVEEASALRVASTRCEGHREQSSVHLEHRRHEHEDSEYYGQCRSGEPADDDQSDDD